MLDPRSSGIPFYSSAWQASTFASLYLLISTATSLMWVAMSNPLDLLEGGVHPREVAVDHLVPISKEVSICQRCSGSWHGQIYFLSPVFRVRETQSQLIIWQQSTFRPTSTIVTWRRVQASMGMRYHSGKIPTNGAGR